MSNLRQAAQQALEVLEANRRSHLYCEDPWYSCPKHEDGCANDLEGDECNCGADEANQKIDQAITALRAALAEPSRAEKMRDAGYIRLPPLRDLAEPEQEPVALPCCGYANASAVKWNPHNQVVQCHNCGQVYTAPTPRKPLTDEEIAAIASKPCAVVGSYVHTFARAIERAHGIGGDA